MQEIVVVQHAASETLGAIEEALSASGLRFRFVRTQDGDPVPPDLAAGAGLVVLGGPMGVHDQAQFPFLADEIRLIQQAVARQAPVLGVCLGAQLLAAALGGDVRQNTRQEIGWHTVTLTTEAAADPLWRGLPAEWTGFHWHGDVFRLPPGAVPLAFSALTPCQAFRFGDCVYGFQFHLEVTPPMVHDWTAAFAGELTGAGLDAAAVLDPLPEYLPPMQAVAREVFGRWARMAAGQPG